MNLQRRGFLGLLGGLPVAALVGVRALHEHTFEPIAEAPALGCACGVTVDVTYARAHAYLDSLAGHTYDGAADLWGVSLTPAQINEASFGVLLK